MKVFEGTDLPDDFFAQVIQFRKLERRDDANATWNAVVALLGRPLNSRERMAIVEALHAGRVDAGSRNADAQAPSVKQK